MGRLLPLLLLLACVAHPAVAQTLKVGISPDYPPLAFMDQGQMVGIEPDNVKAVSNMINRQMKIVSMPFDQLIPALKQGEIDIIMSGLSITDERSKEVLFTNSYMEIGQMAILHRDKVGSFSQPWAIYQEGVRIGVEPGTTGDTFAREQLGNAEILYFENPMAAFNGLRNNEIDLYVHDAPTSWQLARAGSADDLISLYHPLTDEFLAWAVRPGDEALVQTLNTALRTMKANGTLRYILNRWIPVTVEVR
ncbi:MAG: transporter substrate-binding domain-containing protein [Pseudomonadota bacterium]